MSLTDLTIITIVNIYLKRVKQFAQIQTAIEMPTTVIGVVTHTDEIADASYAAAGGKRNYFMRKEFSLLFLIGVYGRCCRCVCWIIIPLKNGYNVF